MSQFKVYDLSNAPEKSRPVLTTLKEAFGFIPNIAGAIAGSPTLINGFISVFQNAHSGTFSEAEIQVLLLTNAVTNSCTWAVAFHSFLALKNGLTEADVDAIRKGGAPSHAKYGPLSALAKNLIEKRGHADADRLAAFAAAGYSTEQVLEVILVSAASTITNYVGTVAQPPLEEAFQPHAWKGAAA